MIDLPPPVRLLLLIADRGRAADYSQSGFTIPVTVRHSRFRKPVRSEKPVITLILVGDEPQPAELQRNAWEVVREMVVDVQADVELATEDSDEDPTGLAVMMYTLAAFIGSLKDEGADTWLGGMCDWISLLALDPDDRSTPDDGRMTRAIRVLYRVRADDENVLLAAGVNG